MKRTLTSLAALVTLIGFFALVAGGLILLAGWPVPSLAELRLAVQLHYVPGQLIRQAAACVAWPCLAWLLVAVIRMGAAIWQDRPARPGTTTAWLLPWVRRAVPALVVCAGLLSRTPAWSAPSGSAVAAARTAAPSPAAGGSHAVVTGAASPRAEIADHDDPVPASSTAATSAQIRSGQNGKHTVTLASTTTATSVAAGIGATYRVQVGDELWDIAGSQCHDPLQWKTIWELNRGRMMVDVDGGRRVFNDAKLILPGWELLMPAGWSPASASPATSTSAAPVVAPAGNVTTPAAPAVTAPAPVAPSIAASAPAAPTPTVTTPATTGPSASQSTGARGATQGTINPRLVTAGQSAGRSSGGRRSQSKRSIPVGPVVGVGGLVAAGVIWMLGCRRREQTFNRQTGRDVPATPAPIEAVERKARAIADHEALRWVDLGLRYLGRLMEDLGEPPAVVLVRAGSIGLEVMIDPPTLDAPGRFMPVDGGITWVLDPAIDLTELDQLADDRWPPLPALVTIGETAAGTVLANLEHAGSLAIEGDPERQRGLLLQILVELTSQPWTDQTLSGVHVLGNAGLDCELPGVDVDDDPMFMAQVLDQLSDRYQRDIDAPSVVVRRAMDGGWEPHVAVAFAEAPPDVLRCVIEAAIPDRSGVAVVAAGPVDGARWRLEVDGDGAAVLSAQVSEQLFVMDLRVDTDTEVMTMLAADLAYAVQPADNPRVVGLRDALPDENAIRKGPVEISVLGPLDIAGGSPSAVESKRRRPALALLAYMATHRLPVTNQELGRALWPLNETKSNLGGGAPSTVHNVVNHAKTILGRGPNGEELLISTPDGYQFTDGVTSAWARFLKYAAVAGGEDLMTRIGTWGSALQLVRGVPLQGNYPGKYFEWFGSERLDDKIKTRVVDVATLLATAALEIEDWDTVKWAVEKGLELDPIREELFQALMHAEGRSGRPGRVNEVYGQLCLLLQKEIDMLQTPSDESEEIWKSYTAESAGRRRR